MKTILMKNKHAFILKLPLFAKTLIINSVVYEPPF